jgi:TonB family protein
MPSAKYSINQLIFACLAISLCFVGMALAQDAQRDEPQPPKIIRKSGGVLQASAKKRIEPVYPPLAKAARISGSVVVEVTTDEEGNVSSVRAISGHPLLKDAAVAAARGWRFTPTILQGIAVKVIGTITFNFGLDHSKDIALFEEAVAADPSSSELSFQLGLLYLENAKPNKAIDPLKQAIGLDPKFAKAYVALGDAYWRTNHTELAIDAYKEAARVKPDYADAHFYLGMLYWREDRHNEAVKAFSEAAKFNPQMHMAYVGMGRSYRSIGRYNEAVEAFKQAVKVMPDSLDAHLELGETYLTLGDKEAAMNEYRILKDIKPFMAEQLLDRIKKNK